MLHVNVLCSKRQNTNLIRKQNTLKNLQSGEIIKTIRLKHIKTCPINFKSFINKT